MKTNMNAGRLLTTCMAAMLVAGVQVEVRIGPDVGKNPQADSGAIVAFLRQQLFPREDAR